MYKIRIVLSCRNFKLFPYLLLLPILFFAKDPARAKSESPAIPGAAPPENEYRLGGNFQESQQGKNAASYSSLVFGEVNVAMPAHSGRIQIFVERRENKQKQQGNGMLKRALFSIEAQYDSFYLSMGNRYMPGPISSYLVLPQLYAGIRGAPSGRSQETIFAAPCIASYCAGLFLPNIKEKQMNVENSIGAKNPGIFFANRKRSALLFYHPRSRRGGLSLNLKNSESPYHRRFYADLLFGPDDASGFMRYSDSRTFSKTSSPAKVTRLRFIAEAQRDPDWDRGYAGNRSFLRKGKSGKIGTAVNYSPDSDLFFLDLRSAGQDRYGDGFRLGEMQIVLGSESRSFRPVVRARYLHRMRFEPSGDEKERNASNSHTTPLLENTDYRNGAFGLFIGSRTNYLLLLYESQWKGSPGGEIQAYHTSRNFSFSFAAAAVAPQAKNSNRRERFLTLMTPDDRSSSWYFYDRTIAALRFRFRSKNIYVMLQGSDRKKKQRYSGTLQTRFVF